MKKTNKFEHRDVLKSLVQVRGDLSLMEQEFAIEAQIQRETADWVPMWVDLENSVRSERVGATAYRAITDKGDLLWYVRRDGKKKGYHSPASTATEAFADAESCWSTRRAIKQNWRRLEVLQNELLSGRKSLDVTVEDARKGGLCVMGIEGFMKRFGISRRKHISGRFAALLMKFEPQVGFAIYNAASTKEFLPKVFEESVAA